MIPTIRTLRNQPRGLSRFPSRAAALAVWDGAGSAWRARTSEPVPAASRRSVEVAHVCHVGFAADRSDDYYAKRVRQRGLPTGLQRLGLVHPSPGRQ
jgi:hypothetical protein